LPGEKYQRWISVDDCMFTNKMHPECVDACDEELRHYGDNEYHPYDNERPQARTIPEPASTAPASSPETPDSYEQTRSYVVTQEIEREATDWVHGRFPIYDGRHPFEVWLDDGQKRSVRVPAGPYSDGTVRFTDCIHPAQNVICDPRRIVAWRALGVRR
jgi:hypothetical protein